MSYKEWTSRHGRSSTTSSASQLAPQGSHSCCGCGQKFATSNQLVIHMREAHPSFVEQTQSRHERHKESRMNMDKESGDRYTNNIATCPFCRHDCQTRKKLMQHLELEHKDDESLDDIEPDFKSISKPEFKVIRLEADQKQQLLESLKTVKAEAGDSQNPTIQKFLKAFESDGTKGSAFGNDIQVVDISPKASAAAIKFPEKRYKCFWCDASFRKRGKLMDHIDLFHKVNKKQNEVEAELLHGTAGAPGSQGDEKPANSNGANFDSPVRIMGSPPLQRFSPSSARSSLNTPTYSGSQPAFPTPVEKRPVSTTPSPAPSVCIFKLVGSIREQPRPPPSKLEPDTENICKFYNGRKSNPLLETQQFRRPSNPSLQQNAMDPGFRGLPQNFPRMMSPVSPQDLKPMHPFFFGPGGPSTAGARMPHPSLYYQNCLPFMVPQHELMLNQQHQMAMGQASPPQLPQQYLATKMGMATVSNASKKTFTTDGPLDLTKTK